MVRVHVFLKQDVIDKLDAQRGAMTRSKAIRKALRYLLDQDYLHTVIQE